MGPALATPRPPVDTDRNLLFGVLALQLDVIDRDSLISACLAWTARQDTPLADFLVSQGFLTAAARATVDERLREYAGDAQASTAETPGDAWRQVDGVAEQNVS